MIIEHVKAAQTEVENHSIYVWGGGAGAHGGIGGSGIVIIRNAR